MSHYDQESLYELLPAVYRIRDAELGYPLRGLVGLLAREAEVVEQDIARLYENWFIETCDEWVVPYIGDLIGVRQVHVDSRSRFSRRAEVANTISYRRRKGTAAVLEQLARDVTGWAARVVELFELLETTQYLNHVRLHSLRTPDLRSTNALELVDGPFETAAHSAEVRRIPPRLGRYNIPNLGIYVWRLIAYPLEGIEAREVDDGTGLHFSFSTLGNDIPLFNQPRTETSATHIAEEINVPTPIRRRDAYERKQVYYGPRLSLLVVRDGLEIDVADIRICSLDGWVREPAAGEVAIDPALGRLAFASGEGPSESVRVAYSYGFADHLGGGPYERSDSLSRLAEQEILDVGESEAFDSLADALAEWVSRGRRSTVIVIHDSRTYSETPSATIPAEGRLEIRSANEERPTLLLGGEMAVSGGAGSVFEINGLLVANHPLRITGEIDSLAIRHTTLVPGRSLAQDGTPLEPGQPSLIVESVQAEAEIERSILGPIWIEDEAEVSIADSILDAGDRATAAYADASGAGPGGPLTITRCTVVGTIGTRILRLGENSLFLGPVVAERRQEGCVRYSLVAAGSRVPRRFRCQPVIPEGADPAEVARLAARVAPRFTSLLYGEPAYCQLHWRSPAVILRGADDESEMGVFSSLQQPQREDALRVRLDEYLPVGLEAGILFAT